MRRNVPLIAAALTLLFSVYLGTQLFLPVNFSDQPVEVRIPEGSSLKQALAILAQNRLMRDINPFLLIGRITGADRKVRAGYYPFMGPMSPYGAFVRLTSGKIIEYEITVAEGETLDEIGGKLSTVGVMPREEFDRLARDREFLESLGIGAPTVEGYLFPQTYRFPKGALPGSVLRHMVQMLRDVYSDSMRERAREIGWTENQVLTLASIIEKEAVVDNERPLIAAVYHNRIRKGMPLQADPTAIYGVKSHRSRITKADLRKETDYNTYVISGLPPGPIASPGIRSIQAALYPADVPYLYFVSKRDGTHQFSTSLSQHNAAIRRIRGIEGRGSGAETPESGPRPEESGGKEG